MSFIHYYGDKGSTFDLVEILLENLIESIIAVKNTNPRNFSNFHMSSYVFDIMCMAHQYPKIGLLEKHDCRAIK
jgi:hypothetical protein